jgi:monoamine oxidase
MKQCHVYSLDFTLVTIGSQEKHDLSTYLAMKSVDQRPRFRVLIAGGGIAGLTLVNALQHAGIDYLLFEARSKIAPQLGASIGLGPNGSRILDQLGCYDEIMKLTDPIDYTGSHRPNGDYIRPKTDAFRLVQAR